jgi:hypothetical protein
VKRWLAEVETLTMLNVLFQLGADLKLIHPQGGGRKRGESGGEASKANYLGANGIY